MTGTTSGEARAFRFGIVAPFLSDLPTWREQVKRIAAHGYSTVLMPDFPQLQPSPLPRSPSRRRSPTSRGPSRSMPLRFVRHGSPRGKRARWRCSPRVASRSASGSVGPASKTSCASGDCPCPHRPNGSIKCAEAVAALRELDGAQDYTPVAMAVIGPKARALAAEIADTVTFAMAPDEPRAAVVQRVRDFQTTRDTRDVELSIHVPVVGNTVSPFMATPDTDTTALREADSLAYLPPDPAAAADELRRRREETGVSYFAFGANVADTFAPLVAELAGQ